MCPEEAALQRPFPEGLHLLIEQTGDPADLGFRDPQPRLSDDLIDAARGDAADIGLMAAESCPGSLRRSM